MKPVTVLIAIAVALAAVACVGTSEVVGREFVAIDSSAEGCEGRDILRTAYGEAIKHLTDDTGELLVGRSALFHRGGESRHVSRYGALEFLLEYQKLLQLEADRGDDAICQRQGVR